MIVLSCDKLTKSFGINTILDQITFSVSEKSRMGIVGPNGAGKTTLFRLITGELTIDEGSIYKAKDLTIGYLKQNETVDSSISIWEELLTVFAHAWKWKSYRVESAFLPIPTWKMQNTSS